MVHTPRGTQLARFANSEQFFCKQVVCLFSRGLTAVFGGIDTGHPIQLTTKDLHICMCVSYNGWTSQVS